MPAVPVKPGLRSPGEHGIQIAVIVQIRQETRLDLAAANVRPRKRKQPFLSSLRATLVEPDRSPVSGSDQGIQIVVAVHVAQRHSTAVGVLKRLPTCGEMARAVVPENEQVAGMVADPDRRRSQDGKHVQIAVSIQVAQLSGAHATAVQRFQAPGTV